MEEVTIENTAPQQEQPEAPAAEAPSTEECLIAARQLQKYLEEKPFPQGGDFFMDGLIRHGELDATEISPTVRVWRAVKRIEMRGEDLAKYGFIVPAGFKRVYQMEVSLVCDTVKDDVMEVNSTNAKNVVEPEVEHKNPANILEGNV